MLSGWGQGCQLKRLPSACAKGPALCWRRAPAWQLQSAQSAGGVVPSSRLLPAFPDPGGGCPQRRCLGDTFSTGRKEEFLEQWPWRPISRQGSRVGFATTQACPGGVSQPRVSSSPSHRQPHPRRSWPQALGTQAAAEARFPVCFLAAVQIHILKADKAGDWWKFTVNIISVYKQGASRIRRGDQNLWIRSRDIACKCPKIKPLKKYLLLGNAEDSPDQSGIVADKSSLVIQWRDTWARRLRKFQQREKKGKCKKA